MASRGAAAAVVVICGIGFAGAGYGVAEATSSNTMHACVAKSGGAVRVAARCTKKEKVLTWAKAGPRGRTGTRGPAGLAHVWSETLPVGSSVALPADNAYHRVVGLTVPVGGDFLVDATVGLYTNAGNVYGNCQLTVSGFSDPVAYQHFSLPALGSAGELDVSLGGSYTVVHVSAGASIWEQCVATGSSAGQDGTITATQVAAVN
jgi:hypothetical protein